MQNTTPMKSSFNIHGHCLQAQLSQPPIPKLSGILSGKRSVHTPLIEMMPGQLLTVLERDP